MAEELERALLEDLDRLGDRLGDEEFTGDLYRGLANNVWHREGGPPGQIALGWSRAEAVVNELRSRHDREPMALHQTGGEGWVSATVDAELGRLGWRHRPLDTGRQEDAHAGKDADSPPPRFQGEGAVGAGDPREERRQAHEAAQAERRRRAP